MTARSYLWRIMCRCLTEALHVLHRISRNIQYPVLTYVSQMLLNFRSRAQGYLMSFSHLNVSLPPDSTTCIAADHTISGFALPEVTYGALWNLSFCACQSGCMVVERQIRRLVQILPRRHCAGDQ